MKTILFALLIILYVGTPSLEALPNRHALIIGNDDYSSANSLKNARNDAKAIATVLESLGYVVVLQLDADSNTLNTAIRVFSESLHPGDIALLFYSGHGLQAAGENYLVPTDFNANSITDLKRNAYPLSAIVQTFADHGATTQLVILDACRDDPFAATRSIQSGWATVQGPAGTFLAFGTAPGSTASDNPAEQHGLFTKALLEYITSPLEVDQMFERVREEVIRSSHGLQVPWVASSLTGSLHILPQLDSGNSNRTTFSTAGMKLKSYPLDRSRSATISRGTEGQAGFEASDPSSSDSESVPILVTQGMMLAARGNYDEAMRSLSEALTLNPQCSVALRVLGLLFHLAGRGTDALEELNRAVLANPQDKAAYYYRGLAEVASDPLAAVRDCEASIGLDPQFAEAHLGLANALFRLGQLDRAYAEAGKGVSLAPQLGFGFALRGKIASGLGMYASASRDYDLSVRLSNAQQ